MAKIIIDGFGIAHKLMEAITEYTYEHRYEIENKLGYDNSNDAISACEKLDWVFKKMVGEKKQ